MTKPKIKLNRFQKYYLRNKQKVIDRATAWNKDNNDRRREICAKWRKNNKRKRKAHRAVEWAVKTGKIVRGCNCERCGSDDNIQAHHANYDKVLDVEWLCPKCHALCH